MKKTMARVAAPLAVMCAVSLGAPSIVSAAPPWAEYEKIGHNEHYLGGYAMYENGLGDRVFMRSPTAVQRPIGDKLEILPPGATPSYEGVSPSAVQVYDDYNQLGTYNESSLRAWIPIGGAGGSGGVGGGGGGGPIGGGTVTVGEPETVID
jgi:hypothetical protein